MPFGSTAHSNTSQAGTLSTPVTVSNDCNVAVFRFWPGVSSEIKMDKRIDNPTRRLCQCVTSSRSESLDNVEWNLGKLCSKDTAVLKKQNVILLH